MNSTSSSSITFVGGIFINNTALKVQELPLGDGRFSRALSVFHMISTTSTDPINIKYRVGTVGGATAYMNALFGAAIYGHTNQSYIKLREETP